MCGRMGAHLGWIPETYVLVAGGGTSGLLPAIRTSPSCQQQQHYFEQQLRKSNSFLNGGRRSGTGEEAVPDAGATSFQAAFRRHEKARSGTTWIVKPVSLNRGNGIEMFNTYEDVMTFVEGKKSGVWTDGAVTCACMHALLGELRDVEQDWNILQ